MDVRAGRLVRSRHRARQARCDRYHPAAILERLKLRPEAYLKFIRRDQETRFGHFIGAVESMKDLAQQFGKRFLKRSDRGCGAVQSGLDVFNPIKSRRTAARPCLACLELAGFGAISRNSSTIGTTRTKTRPDHLIGHVQSASSS